MAATHDRAGQVHERAARQAASVGDLAREEHELALASKQYRCAELERERCHAAEDQLGA